MMTAAKPLGTPRHAVAFVMIWLMVSVVVTPLFQPVELEDVEVVMTTETSWQGLEQPWAQYARTPTHNQTAPDHSPDGGPGMGSIDNVTSLATLENPIVNWQVFSDQTESDAYGSVIGDFSQSVSASETASQRCGEGTLFPVMVSSEIVDSTRTSYLNIVSGNDAKIAWRVSLGTTETVRSTPIIHDIDDDGFPEVIVTYDTQGAFNIDVWSPRLTCTEANWQTSGHSNELVWSYSDADVRIGSPSPHWPTANSDHLAVTQPLLADLQLDGTPEVIVALVDDPNNNPLVKVNAYSLTTAQPTEEDWSVALDRGTHPSDPVWAQLDSTTTSVVLTTIDGDSGNMWIWKIDGSTGSLDWERVAVQGTDSDSDSPRLRLPGPVIVQLDQDSAPEMILTVPTDANGRTSGSGARFIGMELTSTTEVFNFRAQNGYADAQPMALDTDDDGIDDRLCWVTWYSEESFNFNRKGMLGCTDISDSTPVTEWTRDLQRGAGTDNDEIAASPPFWLDIDGEGTPEVLVGFGRRFWAFDGDTGASADINNAWSTPLSMPHRVWAAPALADVDGDGHIDVLFGDTLVSNQGPDLTPALDNRGLSFNPAQADPGATVTVTGQFANVGTAEADDDVDAAIIMNGIELKRERFTTSEPIAPSGEGGPLTFSAEFVAELGVHEFELVLDVNQNISEQREDNNRAATSFSVVEPYLAELTGPLETPRIPPGTSQTVDINLLATGSKPADWSIAVDDDQLPEGWSFELASSEALTRELVPNVPQTMTFDASVPSTALGDESGMVSFLLSLVSDPTVNTTLDVQLDVFRTRGLDLSGSSGMNSSQGQGRPGQTAKAWFMVENLGNAPESTTSITWTAPSWGGSPSIHDASGQELFSIALDPGESKALFAHLPTPSSSSFGSSTQSTLTLCMGSGEDALCESMPFTFTAQKFVAQPAHHRTLPDATLTWNLVGTAPVSGTAAWSMSSMGMFNSNWQWNASGDFTVNGTTLEAQGTPGDTLTGSLVLELPTNAVPKRHVFAATDAADLDASLNMSLHVLQVHRANVSLIEPTPLNVEEAISLNVSEEHRFLLFLENPGNGVDTFELTAEVSTDDPLFTPEVTFTYYDPQKTLGALATGIGTVDVFLSAEIPALAPFTLTFTWTSLGGDEVANDVSVFIQAAPSHEWQVDPVNLTSTSGIPGEFLTFGFNLTNLGNAPDALTLQPSIAVTAFGSDASVWSAESVQTSTIGINGSVQVNFSIQIPTTAWATTAVNVSLAHLANAYSIGQTHLNIGVDAVSGWKLNLTNADLEVDPAGENLTFQLVHTGNAYERPYFAKAGAGWNITLPQNAVDVAPYTTTTFDVHVQPPEEAIAGEVGVLRIRITGNDTSGLVVEEIPVRVGASPEIDIDHRGEWNVNQAGGYPTAWVENKGNDIAMLTIDVDGLPDGWSTDQGTQLILAPGEVSGLPLNLVPSSDWNEQRFLLSINVNHPLLGAMAHSIEVKHSHVVFSQTPVIDAYVESQQTVSYMVENQETVTFAGALETTTSGQSIEFLHPTSTGEYVVSFSGDTATGNISIYAVARQYPAASIDCSLSTTAFDDLGRVELAGTVATCDLTAGENEELRAVLTLITSKGERIDLDSDVIVVGAGGQETINVSVSGWDPAAGLFDVVLSGTDQFGRTLSQESTSVVSRESGWNVGISSLGTDGDITIGIKRTGYELLTEAVCELDVVAEGGWQTTYIVDVAYAEFAPVIFIENPGAIERDEKITATLGCSVPFDVDDNADDDSMSSYYKAESILTVSTNEIGWVVGVAALVLAIAWLLGAIQAPRATPPSSATKKPNTKDSPQPESQRTPTTERTEEDDDFNLQIEENVESEVEDEPAVPVDEVERESSTEVVESIEVIEEEDTTASGRLASMRDELGEGDGPAKEGSIEDRMKKFFGDGS